MTLPATVRRCPGIGTETGFIPDCADCRRRLEPPAGPMQSWMPVPWFSERCPYHLPADDDPAAPAAPG